MLALSWFLVGVAFLEKSFLAESGRWLTAGNWSWGYLYALKIVFIYSAIALFSSESRPGFRPSLAWWPPLLLLGLHFGSGLIYLEHIMAGTGYLCKRPAFDLVGREAGIG